VLVGIRLPTAKQVAANPEGETGPVVTDPVLRSWEERYGAEVMVIGFDEITMSVRRPPAAGTEAASLAAEHFAVCSDNIYQGVGSLEAYSAAIADEPTWTFWWD
jgi:hypothetical protein